jgi:hypothetical protein
MQSPLLLVALASVFPLAAALAGPVVNGNFETAFTTDWTEKDQIPTNLNGQTPFDVTVTRAAGARTGGNGAFMLHVAGRDHVQDGPLQGSFVSTALRTSLIANGNGRTYSTRVWVRLHASAAEASVRCLLRWRDNNVQQTPLILAECVLTGQDGWVQMTSTAKLQWVTSLSAATIDFECEQLHRGTAFPPPATWFPAYDLDDLAMELDDDGDGLFNTEESANHAQTTISFSDSADSDGDRMTDDWEIAHGLSPRDASDAAVDLDGDEFTNVQEYFGATDPRDAAQYPGKPSDPLATHETRALLRYLALRPWRQEALVGQMVSDNATEYTAFVAALAAQPGWGRWPSILGLAVEKGNGPLDIAASVDHAIPYANAGGIAQIKWAMWNPWTGNFTGDQAKIDIPGLLNPAGTPTTTNTAAENQAARAVLLGWIDTVGAELQRYNAATNSKPMFFRPISEMNGAWFWWGHRTRDEYTGLWNFVRDRLMTFHGLHNLIWIYESAQSEHVHPVPTGSAAASDYYYPGDNRVDVMAHNLYDDDWVLPFEANKLYSRYPKIYGVPQAGPGKTLPTSRDGSFDNMTYITQIAARYPRMSFFIAWNSFTTNGGANTEHLAIIDNTHPDQLMTDSRVITRDELRWRPPTSPAASAVSSNTLALAWAAEPTATSYRVELSANGVNGWSFVANAAGSPQSAIGLTPATTAWLRVRSLFADGTDSLPTDAASATTVSKPGTDFNQDGKPDLVWRHDGGAICVWFMNGINILSGTFFNPSATDPSWRISAVGDFNADGKPDLIWRHDGGAICVWFMDGINLLSSSFLNPNLVAPSWKISGVGDFNQDGKLDLVWREDGGLVGVWFMDGINLVSGALFNPSQTDPSWKISAVGDFNQDGKPDLVWRQDSGLVGVWFMDGINLLSSTSFNPSQTDPSWKISGVGDFNLDGKPDLVWRHDSGAVGVWLMNGINFLSGSFFNPSQVDPSWKIPGP